MRRFLSWLFLVVAGLLLGFVFFVGASGVLRAVVDEKTWRQVLAVRTEEALTEYGERCLQCVHRATVTATLDQKVKDDGQVGRLQNIASYEPSRGRVQYKEDPFWEAALTHDGRAVHSVNGGILSSWATDSGQRLRRFAVAPYGNSDEERRLTGSSAVAIVALPSNARAAVLSDTGSVSIWDVERQQLVQRCQAQLPGKGLEASEQGTWVGWIGQDQALAWNPQRGVVVKMAHPGVSGIVFVGEDEALSVSPSLILRWDLKSSQVKARLPMEADGKYLGHSRRGGWLYFTVQGQLTIHDATTGALSKKVDARDKPLCMACSGGDERLLAAGSDDGTYLIWDQQSGQLLAEQAAHSLNLEVLRCSAATQRILSLGMQRREARVWDPERFASKAKRAQMGVPIQFVFAEKEWWLQGLVDRALDGQWLDRAPWLVEKLLGWETQLTAGSAAGLFLLFYFGGSLIQYSRT
jgi:hypothetical protein